MCLGIIAVWVECHRAVVNEHFVVLINLFTAIVLRLLLGCKRKMLTKQIIIFYFQICILLLRGLVLTAVEDVEINLDQVVFLLSRSVVSDRMWAPYHPAIFLMIPVIPSDVL